MQKLSDAGGVGWVDDLLHFMKRNLLLVFLMPLALCAQTPMTDGGPQPAMPRVPTPGGPDDKGGARLRDRIKDRMLDELPPEMRERFEAAKAKALQDPRIQELKKKADAAGDEFRSAMREAMMKADPELAEMLKKFTEKRMPNRWNEGRPPGLGNLSDADREKLMAAREKAKSDPAVVAAVQMRDVAKTPEERAAAAGEFLKAMRAALLKVDPTLGPVLEKMKPLPPPDGSAPST